MTNGRKIVKDGSTHQPAPRQGTMRAVRSKKPAGVGDQPSPSPYATSPRGSGQRGGSSGSSGSGKLEPLPTAQRRPSSGVTVDITEQPPDRALPTSPLGSPGSPRLPPPVTSHFTLQEQEKLDALIAEYDDAVAGLNKDRQVLQSEVQRVLQLERQREEELTAAVEVNEQLMEQIAELRDSISSGGADVAQRALIRHMQDQLNAVQGERDKALEEVDGLYAEVQSLQSQVDSAALRGAAVGGPAAPVAAATARQRQEQQSLLEDLKNEVYELTQDVEHGYQVLEGFKEELDDYAMDALKKLASLQKEREELSEGMERVCSEVAEAAKKKGSPGSSKPLKTAGTLEAEVRGAKPFGQCLCPTPGRYLYCRVLAGCLSLLVALLPL
mmetsp:Transcript_3607/g.10375  ORF Transcript_3607/g.10375 Transcript_3607/m.10375 type:complete len:384 (-) Transcript_3607:2529-3680(-)